MSLGNTPSDDPHSDLAADGSAEAPEPVETPAEPIGTVLSRARLAAGMTVDQVSERTRVRVPLVLAIETDDYSRCGGSVYARGHIRALARAVGADGAALVAQYDAEHGDEAPQAGPAQIFETERIRPERRRPSWAGAMVAAIVVVLGFVAFSLFSGGPLGGGSTAGNETASARNSPSTKPKPDAHKKASQKPGPRGSAVAAAPTDRVTLKVTAAGGRSWAQVTDSSGRTLYREILNQGESKTFQDKRELHLIVGNAGAVSLLVNGKNLGAPGNEGQIRKVSFTPGEPELG